MEDERSQHGDRQRDKEHRQQRANDPHHPLLNQHLAEHLTSSVPERLENPQLTAPFQHRQARGICNADQARQQRQCRHCLQHLDDVIDDGIERLRNTRRSCTCAAGIAVSMRSAALSASVISISSVEGSGPGRIPRGGECPASDGLIGATRSTSVVWILMALRSSVWSLLGVIDLWASMASIALLPQTRAVRCTGAWAGVLRNMVVVV